MMVGSSPDTDSGSEEELQVESLVAGRQRRQNAGNRMATLLATEEPVETLEDEGDELKLLFQEDGVEEDEEFASGDDIVSDVEMDSSSEDEGANQDDEDAGEKELEQQAKDERKRKRKALETFSTSKKRKTELKSATKQTISSASVQPRPKKKSERVSWLPTADEGPTRASSRKQTVQNKQVIHERMKENEVKSLKTRKQMEASARRKEAERSKVLTQADRLAEAAQVEARNAKTLNRWQTAENKRVAEQKARLDAMKNRTLEGPVLSIWSGPGKIATDGKVLAYGKKASEKERAKVIKPIANSGVRSTIISTNSAPTTSTVTTSIPGSLQSTSGDLNGFKTTDPPQPGSPLPIRSSPNSKSSSPPIQHVRIESKTLVLLNESACKEPSIQSSMLLKSQRSMIKLHGKLPEKERCLITGQYARYRDPKTGIPYATLAAYRQLRAGEAAGVFANGRWSTLLGQYVGIDAEAPADIPEILRIGS